MSTGAGNTRGSPSVASKKVEIPENQSATAQAAAPIASMSSQLDPAPHYIMSMACAGGAGWAYNRMNNPRAAAIAGGFSALYFLAGRLLVNGHERLGYDLGTVTSLALLGTAGPAAWGTGEAYSTALATAGGISSMANFIKSYQLRTGKPMEARVVDKQ